MAEFSFFSELKMLKMAEQFLTQKPERKKSENEKMEYDSKHKSQQSVKLIAFNGSLANIPLEYSSS